MFDKLQSLANRRQALATAAVAVTAGVMVATHAPADEGLAAADITPELVAQTASELGIAPSEWTTGKVLLDFVEPEDGEGGSEEEIAALVAELDAIPGVDIEPAGFYSESEHLYRLSASVSTWDRIDDDLLANDLLEVAEPEILYALPKTAAAVADYEPQKGERVEVNDPMFKLQWHMEQIHAPEAWASQRGDGVVVAVIDTGVAWKDASGVRQLPDLEGTKFTKGESFISGLPDGLDDHAHGSHVAGTIAQTTNNGIGVTGVAYESTIMPLKVLSGDGRGSVPGIANAIRYAADNGAQVINMSLGGPLPSRVLAKAIEYAHSKGVTTVCAAGNESRSRVGYPAANKHAVAVSATNYDRGLTFYSNWGKDIDVAAPGGDTRNDKNGDGHPDGVLQNTIKIQKPMESDYLWFQGTSMASPHAAGVAALIVGEGITNPDEVERIMKETAVHPGGKKWDKKFGAGIIDAQAAVAKAHTDYAPERGGLAFLFGLLALGGVGLASARGRNKALGLLGLGAAAAVASGAFGFAPLAYAFAGLTGTFGSGLWMSAALPFGLALVGLGYKPARPVLAGLALGYAAMLAHGALVLPTLLSGVPGGEVADRLWLAVNAGAALWLASRISKK
ncbi:MAG: S8 family peptidase [Nannocystaceae bacterium]|nr:S8 family peptidase [bacterium]